MEPLFHLLIPVLFLMAFFPKIKKKLILLLTILAILPDFDIFIPEMHRIAFHNVFFMLIIALIMLFTFGKLPALISLFFLGSHLIMDLCWDGTAIFWPLYNKLVAFEIEIFETINTGTWNFIFNLKLNVIGKIAEAIERHYLTTYGTLLFGLVILLLLIKYFNLKKQKNLKLNKEENK